MTEPHPEPIDLAQVSIRLAEPRDHAVIHDLFLQGLEEGMLRTNDTGADVENLQDGYFSDGGQSGFWVAEYQGKVVGMIGVQRTSDDVAEVRRLRVDNAFRRQGIGSKLVEQAVAFCRHHSYLKVVLDIRIERGPAIALFKNCGFELARTREIDGRKMLDFYLDIYRDPNT